MFDIISTKKFFEALDAMDPINFLDWFQKRTEEEWKHTENKPLEVYETSRYGGIEWRPGTKWNESLSENEINTIERKYQISFPAEYRLFLAHLGVPDRDQIVIKWHGDKIMRVNKKPGFHDWKNGLDQIDVAIQKPLKGILSEVEYGLWGKNWGKRPNSQDKREQIVTGLVAEASLLIPIYGHRYLVGSPLKSWNPVLSIGGRDIIIYGTDFRKYLLFEFAELLNINGDNAYENAVQDCTRELIKSIPFWGDIILGNYDWEDDLAGDNT